MKRVLCQYCKDDVLTQEQQAYLDAVKAELFAPMPATSYRPIGLRKAPGDEEPIEEDPIDIGLIKGGGVIKDEQAIKGGGGVLKRPILELAEVTEVAVIIDAVAPLLAVETQERETAVVDMITTDEFDSDAFAAQGFPWLVLGVWAWTDAGFNRDYALYDTVIQCPHNFSGWPELT
jgi:hypothetical protein